MLERDNLFAVGDEFQSIYGFRHADVEIFRERGRGSGTGRDQAVARELPLARGAAGRPQLRVRTRVRRGLRAAIRRSRNGRQGAAGRCAAAVRSRPCHRVAGRRGRRGGRAARDREGGLGGPRGAVRRGRDGRAAVAARRGAGGREAPARGGRGRPSPGRHRRPGPRGRVAARCSSRRSRTQGLPTYVVGGRGYWSQEQVRDGIAYLSVLANPLDETALYHVLASPLAGASSADLYRIARAARDHGGAWAALQGGRRRPGAPRADRRACSPPSARRRSALPVEVLLERAIVGHRLRPRDPRARRRGAAARQPAQADAAGARVRARRGPRPARLPRLRRRRRT